MNPKQPLHLDQQPAVGDTVLGISYRPLAPGTPSPVTDLRALELLLRLDALVVGQQRASRDLLALTEEVHALRRDLQARSLEGRWHRFILWCRELWRF